MQGYMLPVYTMPYNNTIVSLAMAENETIYLIVHHPFIIFLGGMQL